jgi:hypothetical protein
MESNGGSIVQGSGLWPKFYTVLTSDSRALSKINQFFILADDTNLKHRYTLMYIGTMSNSPPPSSLSTVTLLKQSPILSF